MLAIGNSGIIEPEPTLARVVVKALPCLEILNAGVGLGYLACRAEADVETLRRATAT
jgi:hypothetical protein